MTSTVGGRPAQPDASGLSTAMDGIWQGRRAQILGHVDVLDAAVMALLEGTLRPALQERAVREAHKLAGAVGWQ